MVGKQNRLKMSQVFRVRQTALFFQDLIDCAARSALLLGINLTPVTLTTHNFRGQCLLYFPVFK
jgi:hypothetical protein